MMQGQTSGPHSRESEGGGLFVFGMLFGALTGAAVAMWKAVRSGAETRRLIVATGASVRNRAWQAMLRMRDRAVAAVVGARGRIMQTQAEIRYRAQAAVNRTRDRVSLQARWLRQRITGERLEDAVAEGKAIARQRQSDLARGRQ
jgi:gas vesicle protein